MGMETLKQKLERVMSEPVAIEPYNPLWPRMFILEKNHLLSCFSGELIKRIEHVGSTAVYGLAAKPIVDMLVEVSSLDLAKEIIVPELESQGYDYFWRPTWGNDIPPFYAWFIKRDATGKRTHHIHMVEHDFEHWDWIGFRDYLRDHPETANMYQMLKVHLASQHGSDRIRYTHMKSKFIRRCIKKISRE